MINWWELLQILWKLHLYLPLSIMYLSFVHLVHFFWWPSFMHLSVQIPSIHLYISKFHTLWSLQPHWWLLSELVFVISSIAMKLSGIKHKYFNEVHHCTRVFQLSTSLTSPVYSLHLRWKSIYFFVEWHNDSLKKLVLSFEFVIFKTEQVESILYK